MVLYADVLVAVNYVVNFLLLLCCERLSGIPQRRRRTMLGALFGGLCSLAIFLPPMNPVWGALIRAGTAAGMLLLAYPRRKAGDYLRLGAILLLVSFLFAGTVLGFCLLGAQDRVAYYNGVVYFHVSPLWLLFTTTAAYGLVGLFRRLFARGRSRAATARVRMARGGRAAELLLLEDTGNRLTEPFSGLPALVCSLEGVAGLLTQEERDWCQKGSPPGELPPGFRLLRYQAVGGSGMLGAFRPERLEVLREGQEPLDCMAYVGVCRDKPETGDGECQGIFNPQVMNLRI